MFEPKDEDERRTKNAFLEKMEMIREESRGKSEERWKNGMRRLISGLIMTVCVLLLTVQGEAVKLDDTLKKAQRGQDGDARARVRGLHPCEQMKPVMEKLSKQYQGRLDVVFVDAEVDREAGRKYQVFMIPTQVFLDRKGKEFHRHFGYYPSEEIVPVLKRRDFDGQPARQRSGPYSKPAGTGDGSRVPGRSPLCR
ncbi:MAG: thioredoxin family protein [Comamonadaceae bacterium]|nr:thioredoxin family protein [Comamonadaceae bacterium]